MSLVLSLDQLDEILEIARALDNYFVSNHTGMRAGTVHPTISVRISADSALTLSTTLGFIEWDDTLKRHVFSPREGTVI